MKKGLVSVGLLLALAAYALATAVFAQSALAEGEKISLQQARESAAAKLEEGCASVELLERKNSFAAAEPSGLAGVFFNKTFASTEFVHGGKKFVESKECAVEASSSQIVRVG